MEPMMTLKVTKNPPNLHSLQIVYFLKYTLKVKGCEFAIFHYISRKQASEKLYGKSLGKSMTPDICF